MKARLQTMFALLGWLALAMPALADERILGYESELSIQPDGSLDVEAFAASDHDAADAKRAARGGPTKP